MGEGAGAGPVALSKRMGEGMLEKQTWRTVSRSYVLKLILEMRQELYGKCGQERYQFSGFVVLIREK